MAYSPLAVANEFIALASAEGRGIEHMALQKLTHFALGYSLRESDEPLVNEMPQVWKFGPVFPSLYQDLKYHGSEPISVPENENYFGVTPRIDRNDERARRIIEGVWDRYKRYSSFQLSDMTHKPDTPWYKLVVEHQGRVPQGLSIPAEMIKEHYEGLPALG